MSLIPESETNVIDMTFSKIFEFVYILLIEIVEYIYSLNRLLFTNIQILVIHGALHCMAILLLYI